MTFVIVFTHPYPQSFCHSILDSVCRGLGSGNHIVDVIHLDNEGFNPVMSATDLQAYKDRKPVDAQVLSYKHRLEQADHLVFIFPIWWELMPALMKGFIEKVIFPGVVYEQKANAMRPTLPLLKHITVITTMDTHSLVYRLVYGNAVRRALVWGTFWKIGYRRVSWIALSRVPRVSDQRRRRWLQKIEKRFSNYR